MILPSHKFHYSTDIRQAKALWWRKDYEGANIAFRMSLVCFWLLTKDKAEKDEDAEARNHIHLFSRTDELMEEERDCPTERVTKRQ